MHRTPSRYLFLLSVCLLISACARKSGGERKEGKIMFQIDYERSQVGGYSTTVLPKVMTMEYRDHMVRNTIEGGLGFFSLVNVSDTRYYQHTTWLKFIDKKYIYEGERREVPCCFSMLDGMQLTFTDGRKEIAGLDCKHAVASFPENGIEPFDVWYTEELQLRNPNANNPFMDIPGVLLEFNTLLGNANMHMVATEYEAQHIPQKHFQPPKNYHPVSKTEMESIITALMN